MIHLLLSSDPESGDDFLTGLLALACLWTLFTYFAYSERRAHLRIGPPKTQEEAVKRGLAGHRKSELKTLQVIPLMVAPFMLFAGKGGIACLLLIMGLWSTLLLRLQNPWRVWRRARSETPPSDTE